MNVIFHTVTAIGVTVALTDTNKIKDHRNVRDKVITGISVFVVSLMTHAVLDYIPHCYPVNSKIDLLISLLIMVMSVYKANTPYRLILVLSFWGSVIPDIIDQGPFIVLRLLKQPINFSYKLFPWHWKAYSGSIYDHLCAISNLNHLALLIGIGIIFYLRIKDLRNIFYHEHT